MAKSRDVEAWFASYHEQAAVSASTVEAASVLGAESDRAQAALIR